VKAGGTNDEPVIGPRLSADGVGRPAHEDAAGRQYVLGPEGGPVYGQWLMANDEPVVIEEGRRP
jgi:hypothetical protein